MTRLTAALADRYRIEREIGQGGMATVFLAEDLRHRRKVAIKVVHPELSAVIGSDRFLKEIELTANLQHPHILPLFDSGDVNGQLYYVMPFVDGETLRSRLDREQQLPVGDAVRIACEVADALAYAHKRGVVHRDIKPENVLLQDGHALVADFGIALAVQQAGAGRLTQTGLSLGTPQYMSPEQAMGERAVDLRTDIYALGAVTYEMLAGEPPFTGPTAQAIIARAMTERPRALSSVRETLPMAVNDAVMVALAKLPADRFASASDFADALVREGSAASAGAPPAGAVKQSTRWIPAATLAAGLLIGAVAVFSAMRTPVTVGDATEPRFWSITLPDSAPFVGAHDPLDIYTRSIDISADGRLVAWTTRRDSSTTSIWQMRTDLGTFGPVPGAVGGAIPTFSPDGGTLAFAVGDEVRKVELNTGVTTTIGKRTQLNALYWPSANRIISASYNGCLFTASPNSEGFSAIARMGCLTAAGGVTSGDDTHGLLASIGGILSLLDVQTGVSRPLRLASAGDTSSASTLVAGEMPRLLDGTHLIFLRDSTLYAAIVDLASARMTTAPRQVLTGVRHEASGAGGGAQFAVSRSGTLVWVSGGDAGVSRFVILRPDGGAADTLAVPMANVNSYALSADGQRLAYTISLPGNASVLRIVDRRRNVVDSARFPIDLQVANWVDADSALSFGITTTREHGRKYGVVRGLSTTMRVDTSGLQYVSSSRDGQLRCSVEGVLWPTASPRDSVRFDTHGNWCRISPDGQHVSWDDAEGLNVAPTTRNAAAARRRIGPPGANEARWSADGRSLLYRTGNKWLAVPSEPAPNGQLVPPRLVLKGTYNQAWASWDLTPDGRLLLLKGELPVRAAHINVLTNFPRFVDEKLKGAARQ
jgi:tRNA A-37 threonylcarbamoyl transferase component Bud32/Tol biopolymer transport system component